MKLAAPRYVLPAEGAAFELDQGDAFRIIDVDGQQVSDLVVFSRADPNERFSPGDTRKLNNSWLLSTGNVLYSTRCRPLLRIAADSVGRHDLSSSACSPYDYPVRFGVADHPSCLAILTDVLLPYGIARHQIPEPFNVFMKTVIDEAGGIEIVEPESRAGDSIVFSAQSPCIVALTCCPQDRTACNGWNITRLRIEPI